MKNIQKSILFIFLLFVTGCAGTSAKYLKPAKFIEVANEYARSADWTTYIGTTNTRIYLEHGSVITSSGNPKVLIYWTELKFIPIEVVEKLRASKDEREKRHIQYLENENEHKSFEESTKRLDQLINQKR